LRACPCVPPPSSPLFPYTTLFRSINHATLRCHSACSAWATAGGTNAETSPPRREISRTSEDEMNPYSSAGVKNRVSAWGIRCRRSEEHTSELQSRENLVCRLLRDN